MSNSSARLRTRQEIPADKNAPNSTWSKNKNQSVSPPPRIRGGAAELVNGGPGRRRQDAEIDPPPDAAQIREPPPPLLLRHAPGARPLPPSSAAGGFDCLVPAQINSPAGSESQPRAERLSTRPDAINSVVYLYRPRKEGSFGGNKDRVSGGFWWRR